MKKRKETLDFELFGNKFKYENGKLKVYTELFFEYVPAYMTKIPANEVEAINDKVKAMVKTVQS